MDIRRKWNAFVGWCLYYPLGGLKKIKVKAYEWMYVRISLKGALCMHTYHEYLVRNSVKVITKQQKAWLRAQKTKEPTKQEKMEIINHWIGDRKEREK